MVGFLLAGARRASGAPSTLLLDKISATKVAAFSTRKLRTAYAGPCLQLRKKSNGNLVDIYFDGNGNVDSAAVAAADTAAQVTTFYDQTGNGNHAVNTSPSDDVPYIRYNSVTTMAGANNRVALDFFHNENQNRFLNLPSLTLSAPPSVVMVANNYDSTSYQNQNLFSFLGGSDSAANASTTSLELLQLYNGTIYGFQNGAQLSSQAYTPSKLNRFSSVFTGTANVVSVNNAAGSSASWTNGLTSGRFVIGRPSNSEISGKFYACEVLILSGSVPGSDLSTIDADQLAYYGAPA